MSKFWLVLVSMRRLVPFRLEVADRARTSVVALLFLLYPYSDSLAQCCSDSHDSAIYTSKLPNESSSGWIEEETWESQKMPTSRVQTIPKTVQEATSISEGRVLVPIKAALGALEVAKFGKLSQKKGIVPRLERLERAVFEHEDYKQKDLSLEQRISDLLERLKPTNEQFDKGFEGIQIKESWIAKTPDDSLVSKLGQGTRRWLGATGRTMDSTGRFLTSPEFIQLVGLAGAIVGLYYLNRAMYKNGATPRYTTSERSCIGAYNCNRCSTCTACPNCSERQGPPCGIWYSIHGYGAPY